MIGWVLGQLAKNGTANHTFMACNKNVFHVFTQKLYLQRNRLALASQA
jgi:hypothetical protein